MRTTAVMHNHPGCHDRYWLGFMT